MVTGITPGLGFSAEPVPIAEGALIKNRDFDKQAGKPVTEDLFKAGVTKFFSNYCYDCHEGEGGEAGLDLSVNNALADAQASRARWNRIRGLIEMDAMPPADHDPLPSAKEKQTITRLIDQGINSADCQIDNAPGRVTMRRLNAAEYDNTIRDLLHVDFKPSQIVGLPTDDVGNGFDNQGEVLTVSSLLMEKYLDAAEEIAQRAIVSHVQTSAGESKPQRAELPLSHSALITATPGGEVSVRDAALEVFEPFLRRAFRRPPSPIEIQRIIDLVVATVTAGETFEQAVALGVQATLASPHFLFRVEDLGPAESHRQQASQAKPFPLGEYELANRLSYFLWASMPDEELFATAAAGTLNTEPQIAQQVERMLQEPGAETLVTRFFAQWLGLTKLDEVTPDLEAFPIWNTRLRDAVREETFRLCREILQADRSLLDLFDADFTYVNPRLAELYGIAFLGQDPRELYLEGAGQPDRRHRRRRASRGSSYKLENRWVRVPTPPGRRGVMTQASVLALTSNPTDTSPVKRGKWVLDVVLGDSPPPAPPTVPSLEESAAGAEDKSLKEQLAIHRENPSCAGCHKQMDPIGLGLENYDAIGRWRDERHGQVIDPAGELNGQSFQGPVELLEIIRRREQDIVRNFTSRLMTYALGRGLKPLDECAVEEIVAAAESSRYQVSTLIIGVATSAPFRMQAAFPMEQGPENELAK